MNTLFEQYRERSEKRAEEFGLPPRPLRVDEADAFFAILLEEDNLSAQVDFLDKRDDLATIIVDLLKTHVQRGTFPESYMKAEHLYLLASGEKKSSYLAPSEALEMLLDMRGGAAVPKLIALLKKGIDTERILNSLEKTVLVNEEDFQTLAEMASSDDDTKALIARWANRSFEDDWTLPDNLEGVAIRVGDNISTDHLSPGNRSGSRTDKPLHATYIMEGRPDEADFTERLKSLRESSKDVFMVAGSGFGEGSSRKSATYTVLQAIGNAIEGEPENRRGGVVIAKSIAPIFRNSLVSSAVLPLICETDEIAEGDDISVDLESNTVVLGNAREVSFLPISPLDLQVIRAGGVNNYQAGEELQRWAVEFCMANRIDIGTEFQIRTASTDEVLMNLAEKIVAMNRIDGKKTIKSGERATVRVRGVFSQDTTGPMTLDEYQGMAGGMKFGAEFVIQSLCHTCEAPTSEERDRQKTLVGFVRDRGGIGLRGGEGIIHTIGNRFVLPTDVIVGGDSHTRTPRGISFPAASDLVASCMKYGKMELVMDKVVKVVFRGQRQHGTTVRDMVSMLVTEAEKQGHGKDIYNGKIIEMYGVDDLSAEEKYILTNAVAERSASAGVIPANQATVADIQNDLEYLKSRPDAATSQSVIDRIKSFEEYLEDPITLNPDQDAEYDTVIEIDMSNYDEPLVAKPHHPDIVVPLSEVAGTTIDEAYIGSCVGGEFDSISTAAQILEGSTVSPKVNLVVSPAAEYVTAALAESGDLQRIVNANGVIIMPTCGLCMGNKRRIGSGSVAVTTTTRNFQGRLGPPDSQAYLASSLVVACCAILGRFPTIDEYIKMIK